MRHAALHLWGEGWPCGPRRCWWMLCHQAFGRSWWLAERLAQVGSCSRLSGTTNPEALRRKRRRSKHWQWPRVRRHRVMRWSSSASGGATNYEQMSWEWFCRTAPSWSRRWRPWCRMFWQEHRKLRSESTPSVCSATLTPSRPRPTWRATIPNGLSRDGKTSCWRRRMRPWVVANRRRRQQHLRWRWSKAPAREAQRVTLGFNYAVVGARNMDAVLENPVDSNIRHCRTAAIDVGIVPRLPIKSRLAPTTSRALYRQTDEYIGGEWWWRWTWRTWRSRREDQQQGWQGCQRWSTPTTRWRQGQRGWELWG